MILLQLIFCAFEIYQHLGVILDHALIYLTWQGVPFLQGQGAQEVASTRIMKIIFLLLVYTNIDHIPP